MKKLSTLLIIAATLVLGLSQCKKENTTTTSEAVGEPVFISLKVDGGDRHTVYTETGAVQYVPGDRIYVGNNGHYIGTLDFANGTFSGTIYGPSTADYLHFYFLGGITPSGLSAGTTSSIEVSISNQRSNLPVLSYGRSKNLYTNGDATYSCTLDNQCALVKFDLPVSSTNVVINDIPNTATVSFAKTTPGISTKANTTGDITLSTQNTSSKWAILLPQAGGNITVSIDDNDDYTVNVPAVAANSYLNQGIAIKGEPVFTVGNNKKVRFSPGNLMHDGDWQFNPSIGGESYVEYAGYCQDNDFSYSDYCQFSCEHGYIPIEYFTYKQSFTQPSQYGGDLYLRINHPCGEPNESFEGQVMDDDEFYWRVLTADEWEYLINSRDNALELYGYATYDDGYTNVEVLVLLPDNCGSVANFKPYNSGQGTFVLKDINNDIDHISEFEAAGAVFLPAISLAMYNTTTENTTMLGNNFGFVGYYIAGGHEPDKNDYSRCIFSFGSYSAPSIAEDQIDDVNHENNAYSVRLVRDVE